MSAPYLDDATFKALREYVRQLCGIHFDHKKRYLLENRVRQRASRCGVSTAAEYFALLRRDDSAAERQTFIADITTNETSFFRHGRQIAILREVLGQLLQERHDEGRHDLLVWSAACSSGEEPFTVAMLLVELLEERHEDPTRWDLAVRATDISAEQVERARLGSYTERQLRSLPDEFRRHFEAVTPDGQRDKGGQVIEAVRRLVQFEVANLTQAPPISDACDVVLCRNVLIYFDDQTRQQVISGLRQALRPGGYLVLGPSDSLHGIGEGFARTPHSTYNFYTRTREAAAPIGAPTAITAAISEAVPSARTDDRTTSAPSAQAPSASETPAASGGSLQNRMLSLRLDHGLQALSRDLDTSVARALEYILKVSEELNSITADTDLDAQQRAALGRASRQLERTLFQLQVGDRGQQRVEALRALLQEMIDRGVTDTPKPVDLGYRRPGSIHRSSPMRRQPTRATIANCHRMRSTRCLTEGATCDRALGSVLAPCQGHYLRRALTIAPGIRLRGQMTSAAPESTTDPGIP